MLSIAHQLQKQGMQMNQTITFLSDGGDTVRDLQVDLDDGVTSAVRLQNRT